MLKLTEEQLCEALRESYHYDPDSGFFTWREGGRGRNTEKPVFRRLKRGYLVLPVGGMTLGMGRAVHLYMTGKLPDPGLEMDHINHDKSDNRWANLRAITKVENNQNRSGPQVNTTTGYRGVSFNKKSGKFEAYLYRDGRQKRLGWFESADDAGEFSSLARAMTMPTSLDAEAHPPRRPSTAELRP